MARLFVALDLPDAAKREILSLRSDIAGTRWTAGSQLHLTLAFLGEVAEDLIPVLVDGLSTIENRAITLTVDRLDVFPSLRDPRVLVLRFDPDPILEAVQMDVARVVAATGIELERRRFKSHVTIARFRNVSRTQLREFLSEDLRLPGAIKLHRLTLYRSYLEPGGARHESLSSWRLSENR